MFYSVIRKSVSGDTEIGWGVLGASTSSTTATRLTADGNPAAASNIYNMVAAGARLFDLTCLYRDQTTGAAASWYWKAIMMTRGGSNSTTAVAAPTATAGQVSGSPGASAPAVAADTTNGGLSLTFTAPNSDASRIVCRVDQVMAQ